MSYIIAMNFISWTIAIWMLMGYGVIKEFEKDLAINNPFMPDWAKRVAFKITQEYYSRSFSGRVAYILWLGAKIMSMSFKMKRRG